MYPYMRRFIIIKMRILLKLIHQFNISPFKILADFACHRIQFSNKKKPLLYEITWMNLKNIMLSEGNQIQISIYCLILFVCNSRIGKVYCNRKQVRFCLQLGSGDQSQRGMKEIFELQEIFYILIVVYLHGYIHLSKIH